MAAKRFLCENHRVNDSAKTRVVAAVIQRVDEYLICQRPTHKRHGGLWEFPGGKLESGESILDAARRELSEELGVDVLDVGDVMLAIDDPGSQFVIEFHSVHIEGEPKCLEHSALAWLTPQELLQRPLAPSDHRFALHLAKREYGETA
jgi:8-oxo-dGTP diphosphatase